MRRTLAIAAALVLALGLAACSDDDDGDETTTADDATTAPASDTVLVSIDLVDEAAFAAGTEPYVVPVQRDVPADDVPQGAVDALFEGPTDEEADDGLALVASEATGASVQSVEDGVATVQLEGGCDSGGSTLTIADQLIPTLQALDEIDTVKVLDPEGTTADPDGPGDSIPACLEP